MDAARIPFSEEDERCIAGAARWGTIIGIISIASAVLTLVIQNWMALQFVVFTPTQLLWSVPVAGVEILLGVFLLQACSSFRKVARTDEADQAYLLAGFRKLRAYVIGQVLTIAVSVAFALFGGLFFLM